MAVGTGWHAVGTPVGTSWCRPARAGGHAVRTARSWRGILSFTHLAREGRMTVTIGRRELLVALGGAAAWPLAARAQQSMPVIGFMSARSLEDSVHLLEAFRRGLKEGGFVEGENVAIEFRWARGDYSRLPALAADLVSREVTDSVAAGGDEAGDAGRWVNVDI